MARTPLADRSEHHAGEATVPAASHHEEVGVVLDDVAYRASQPWPFPQSLMLGFRATAKMTELTIDQDEIEDARWVGRAELADPERRPVRLPNRDSIARFLIEEWLAEGA